jgi:putative SOS response-associated peptidase YedK
MRAASLVRASAEACIVPVDGFFEWKAVKGQKAKQPYANRKFNKLLLRPLAIAGSFDMDCGR